MTPPVTFYVHVNFEADSSLNSCFLNQKKMIKISAEFFHIKFFLINKEQ